MIEAKNIPSKSAHSQQPESSLKDDALVDSAVQTRAYHLYEVGGRIEGRADQDWYQAEIDLRRRSKQA
jgi:Protein of unknown function (DUF2934)